VLVRQAVRKLNDNLHVYLLRPAAKDQKDDPGEGPEAGTDMYLSEPFNPGKLQARVQAGSRILELEERHTAAREGLWLEAPYDAQTGLWNRAAVIDILQCEFLRSAREGSSRFEQMSEGERETYARDGCLSSGLEGRWSQHLFTVRVVKKRVKLLKTQGCGCLQGATESPPQLGYLCCGSPTLRALDLVTLRP